MTQFYKVLVDGQSCHGGIHTWSLPTQNPDGSWTPGDWHSVPSVVPCVRGFHITTSPARWFVHHPLCQLWTCEPGIVLTNIVEDKWATDRIRLLAPAAWPEFNCHIVTDGYHVFRHRDKVVASGPRTVIECHDTCFAGAWDGATVITHDRTRVAAATKGIVMALDESFVTTAPDADRIQLFDNSTLYFDFRVMRPTVVVSAYDNTTVKLPYVPCAHPIRLADDAHAATSISWWESTVAAHKIALHPDHVRYAEFAAPYIERVPWE